MGHCSAPWLDLPDEKGNPGCCKRRAGNPATRVLAGPWHAPPESRRKFTWRRTSNLSTGPCANPADNFILLEDAPNRDSVIAFTDFPPMPEKVAAVSSRANFCYGHSGVGERLEPEPACLPASGAPAAAGPGKFVEVCDEATQIVRGQIRTNVKR